VLRERDRRQSLQKKVPLTEPVEALSTHRHGLMDDIWDNTTEAAVLVMA
jgi:hypothetical protein